MRRDAADVVLELRVVPGASRSDWSVDDEQLRVRIQAPPVDGKANRALIRFLASEFGVRPKDVSIERGESSRSKRVRISAPPCIPAGIEARCA